MVLKTFNLQEDVYNKFSKLCKEQGISMSKQVEFFIESVIKKEPIAKEKYLERLENIRKGKFIRVKDFAKEFGLKWYISKIIQKKFTKYLKD